VLNAPQGHRIASPALAQIRLIDQGSDLPLSQQVPAFITVILYNQVLNAARWSNRFSEKYAFTNTCCAISSTSSRCAKFLRNRRYPLLMAPYKFLESLLVFRLRTSDELPVVDAHGLSGRLFRRYRECHRGSHCFWDAAPCSLVTPNPLQVATPARFPCALAAPCVSLMNPPQICTCQHLT